MTPAGGIGAALIVWAVLAVPMAHAAPDLPALMIFTGTIAADAGHPASRPGDKVLAFDSADRQFVGSGSVGRDGAFHAVVAKSGSFNGRGVVLELQQGRRRFALRHADGSPATVRFAGQLLPAPVRLTLFTGPQTAELSIAEAAEPAAQRLSQRTDLPCDVQSDVNEDGRCDELDARILRLYAGGISRTIGRP